MVALIRIALRLIEDARRWVVLLFLSTESVHAENLFLRRQLALYIERGVQPHAASARRQIRRRDRHGAARAQPIDPSVYAYDAADPVLP